MIDFLNEFNAIVMDSLKDTPFQHTKVQAEYVRVPEQCPCVTIEEVSNTVERKYSDSEKTENYARLQYRIQIFSNKEDGKRAEVRAILAYIDEALSSKGFIRIMYSPLPSLYRSTVYVLTCLYEGVVSEDGVVYHN